PCAKQEKLGRRGESPKRFEQIFQVLLADEGPLVHDAEATSRRIKVLKKALLGQQGATTPGSIAVIDDLRLRNPIQSRKLSRDGLIDREDQGCLPNVGVFQP